MSQIDGHYYDVLLQKEEAGSLKLAKHNFLDIIKDDYVKTLDKLGKLDNGQISDVDLFDYILDMYIRNLRDLSDGANNCRNDDLKLSNALKSGDFYLSAGLDFFRIEYLKAHEDFIKCNKYNIFGDYKKKLKHRRDLQVVYRAELEECMNTLLYMSWQLIKDRNKLSNKSKLLLAEFKYIYPILKQGPNPENYIINNDKLIIDMVTGKKDSELERILRIFNSQEESPQSELTSKLMPKKKKRKKPTKTNK